MRCGHTHRLEELPPSYAHLLGLYLGDGYIASAPRGVFKLRLTLDAAYPGIIDAAARSNTGRAWRHPRYGFSNRSSDIRNLFCETCDLLALRWTTSKHTVYVSRVADVARLDEFVGPKA